MPCKIHSLAFSPLKALDTLWHYIILLEWKAILKYKILKKKARKANLSWKQAHMDSKFYMTFQYTMELYPLNEIYQDSSLQ